VTTGIALICRPGAKGVLARWARHAGFKLLADQPLAAACVVSVGRSTPRAVAEVLLVSARALMSAGVYALALPDLQEAERIANALGYRQWLGEIRRSLGDCLRAHGMQR
jgi:hypothetical protein